MRLYQRGKNEIYWVEFERGKARSLGTSNREEAEAMLREFEIAKAKGQLANLNGVKGITLNQLIDAVADNPTKSHTTKRHDRNALTYLKDVLGDINLNSITTEAIDRFKKATLRHASINSVNSYLRHIKAALRWAHERGYIRELPKVKLDKANKKELGLLTTQQIGEVLSKAKEQSHELYVMLMFYLYTGCRRNEALNLSWDDIVLDNGHSYARLTKTKGKQDRRVPLLPELVEVLATLPRENGKVFSKTHPDTISHQFKRIVRECGIDVRLHDLRHTAITYMIQHGMHLTAVQKIVGHSQISTTMGYTHIQPEFMAREMSKLAYNLHTADQKVLDNTAQ